jgi:hypothetical protein
MARSKRNRKSKPNLGMEQLEDRVVPVVGPTPKSQDIDGDGIADVYESKPIPLPGGGSYDLASQGANPLRKDIFVELDSMEGQDPLILIGGIWQATVKNPKVMEELSSSYLTRIRKPELESRLRG